MNDSDEIERVELSSVHLLPDDFEIPELVEGTDYTLTEDPRDPSNPEKWAIHILTGEWSDWVITFPEVYMEKGGLEFVYECIFHPELPEGYIIDDNQIANYMSTLLGQVLESLQEQEGNVYLDVETGEKIDL